MFHMQSWYKNRILSLLLLATISLSALEERPTQATLAASEVDELATLSYSEIFKRANTTAEQEKNYQKSIALYRYAIERDPSHMEVFFNCGLMFLRLAQPDHTQALDFFNRALAIAPTHAKSLHYRAKCLASLGKKDEALAAYEKALHFNTAHEALYLEYAQLCSDNAKYQRAAELYETAYRLNPRIQTLLSLGNTYNVLNNLDKALECYRTLEEKNPSNPSILYNIAYTLKKLGRVQEAFPYYRKVLTLEPEHKDAHFGLGLSYLITGDFENGFREYEWRWGDKKGKRTMKTPEWDGFASLEGKTLLLLSEQGLGDTFQFIRFGKVVREQFGATHVVAAVQKPLVQLLSLCPYLDKVVSTSDILPAHDYYAYTVSMPYLCKITRETTPTPIPYLSADESLVQEWHEKLSAFAPSVLWRDRSASAHDGLGRDLSNSAQSAFAQEKLQRDPSAFDQEELQRESSARHARRLRVGICWQGNPNYSTQFLRSVVAAKSITLTKLLPLFNVQGVSFYNLQKMTGEEQLTLLPKGTPLISFDDTFDKDHGRFMDTAAVMKNLDLMITVDTGTAHLAAGLGLPTWVFIPNPPDWRWMLDCNDTPWYPNMRLFRQLTIGDWETTIALVCHELETLVRERQAQV